jgi:hypothetical protein
MTDQTWILILTGVNALATTIYVVLTFRLVLESRASRVQLQKQIEAERERYQNERKPNLLALRTRDTEIIFSNLSVGTIYLEFASIRLNESKVPATEILPVTIKQGVNAAMNFTSGVNPQTRRLLQPGEMTAVVAENISPDAAIWIVNVDFFYGPIGNEIQSQEYQLTRRLI